MQAMRVIWEKNLKELNSQLEKLLELRNDVKQQVEVAEGQQMKPMEQVQGWLKRVEECEKEVNKLINIDGNQEVRKVHDEGRNCRNCKSSYKLGKIVIEKLHKVKDLMNEGKFDSKVAHKVLLPTEKTTALESSLNSGPALGKNVGG